jgi:hypothetical protein
MKAEDIGLHRLFALFIGEGLIREGSEVLLKVVGDGISRSLMGIAERRRNR